MIEDTTIEDPNEDWEEKFEQERTQDKEQHRVKEDACKSTEETNLMKI